MFKRIFDITFCLIALIILSPILVSIYLLVRVKLGTPVIFKQVRPGLYGRPFELLKFRSMTDAKDVDGKLLPDLDRLTSFGKNLRASSLDELPELINIIRGDMSLVGPRPLLVQYLPYYTEEEMRRHEVLPGLTGLAQVSGRNAITWEDKLRLDVEYVDKRTFILDIKIIILTIKKIFYRSEILHAAPQGALDSYRAQLSHRESNENSTIKTE